MPLLYGEGDRAFFRLQQEIIRKTDDESIFAIFAWSYAARPFPSFSGILSPDIKMFMNSGDMRLLDLRQEPYQITNKGLKLNVYAEQMDYNGLIFIIPLNCEYGGGRRPASRCAIALREDRYICSRVAVEGLGDHLDWHFPTHRRFISGHGPFFIRLSRWQNEYEPATAIIKARFDRLRQRREEEK